MKYRLLIILFGGLVFLASCSNSSETIKNNDYITNADSKYQKILKSFSNEEWEQASQELNKLDPNEEETKILRNLVNANIQLTKVSGTELNDYKLVLEEMKKIPNKYNDIHSDLIIQFKKILFDQISALELKDISQAIQQEDYDRALNLIHNSIFIYMDSSYLALNNYSYALKNKETNVSVFHNFLFKIPQDYNNIMVDEINKTKAEVTSALVDLVKKKKYEEVLDIIGRYSDFFETENADLTLGAIKSVINILINENEYWDLLKIPDTYNGVMSVEIKKYKKKYKTELDEYQKTLSEIERMRNEPKKPTPQIGMTADEVKASSWGAPKDINKTTTKYGVSEQWVYSTKRYIYFDDGEVTAIQE